ncbi:MAG: DegV family protein [Candidatus Poribacteria bacterium]|nr:DegV family protein [Candidatus Poribacteria bacterium]
MVRVVTDSTADIPKDLVEKYGIEVVPLTVRLGNKMFRDYYDMSPPQFFQMLRETNDFPQTSQPSVDEFIQTYKKIGDKDDIVSIHISMDMSKTAQSASVALQQLPNRKVTIIDSRTVSIGLGLITLEAAKAAKDGANIKDVLNLVEEIKSRTKVYFSVDSLDFLQNGGRIGRAQGFLGTMLKIKQLLAVRDGLVSPVERVRGSNRLINRMVELVKEEADKYTSMKATFIYGETEDNCNDLISQLNSVVKFENLYKNYVGSVITSHAGPTAFGIGFYCR